MNFDTGYYAKLIAHEKSIFPNSWQPMDFLREHYRIVRIPEHSSEYDQVLRIVSGDYYSSITGIFKVQNPIMYLDYLLKMSEYQERGRFFVKTLFHDTSRANVESIAQKNLDWRYGCRFMFGTGVYFSISPGLANRHSTKYNGIYRSMFIVDVLIEKVQLVADTFLPDCGYDTGLCHFGSTFVKYSTNEYYPNYFVNYISAY